MKTSYKYGMKGYEYKVYYVSWSPKSGEATYSRCFDSAEERDHFADGIRTIAKSVSTWAKDCFCPC